MLLLNRATTIGFPKCLEHRFSKGISVENDLTLRISRGTTNNLNQRSRRSEEPLFVGIKHSNQRHFRQINPFSEQIYPHDNINLATPQLLDNLSAINRCNFTMQIKCLKSLRNQKIRYFFRGFFGQSNEQNLSLFRNMHSDSLQKMIQKRRKIRFFSLFKWSLKVGFKERIFHDREMNKLSSSLIIWSQKARRDWLFETHRYT